MVIKEKAKTIGGKWINEGGPGWGIELLVGVGVGRGVGGTLRFYIYNTGENSKYLFFHVIILIVEKRQDRIIINIKKQ